MTVERELKLNDSTFVRNVLLSARCDAAISDVDTVTRHPLKILARH